MGKTYAERQRERVACRECGTVIAAGSMSSHLMKEVADNLLAPPHHGSKGGRILRRSVQGGEGSHAGRPAVPHHMFVIIRGFPSKKKYIGGEFNRDN